jgi:hypothetical protein
MLINERTVGVLKANYELIYNMPIMFIYDTLLPLLLL